LKWDSLDMVIFWNFGPLKKEIFISATIFFKVLLNKIWNVEHSEQDFPKKTESSKNPKIELSIKWTKRHKDESKGIKMNQKVYKTKNGQAPISNIKIYIKFSST